MIFEDLVQLNYLFCTVLFYSICEKVLQNQPFAYTITQTIKPELNINEAWTQTGLAN